MRKLKEYREHAAQCRALAAAMTTPEHRDQLLEMAETWDRMADERARSNRLEQESFSPKRD